MASEDSSPTPFSSLIAASSLAVGALCLVGFSYRWSFYFNFGVPEIVFGLSLPTFLFASLEIFRHPLRLLQAVAVIALAILAVEGVFAWHRLAIKRQNAGGFWRLLAVSGELCGLKNSLARDVFRTLVIAYGLYVLSVFLGYQNYLAVVSGRAGDVFPAVTLLQAGSDGAMPFACGQTAAGGSRLVGDAIRMGELKNNHRACSLDGRTWRLLFRDDKFFYLFESRPSQGPNRALTLVAPVTNSSLLILNG